MRKLYIDIETYNDISIRDCGAYRYAEDDSLEILMLAFAFDDEPIEIVDLAQGEKLPPRLVKGFEDPTIEKHAHNAVFERRCLLKAGYNIPINQWFCTSIKAGYCGWPLSLDNISKAMDLGDKGKDNAGKALIRYFCMPCKPTKTNGGRTRNLPEHAPEKWEQFKDYCVQDVAAEREIDIRLNGYEIPTSERVNYILDQEINDRGILIDLSFADNAISFDKAYTDELKATMKKLTGLENPNSAAQLKNWLSEQLNQEVKTLRKADIGNLISEAGDGPALGALRLRKKLAKTSIKKYSKMLEWACADNRARGLFQYYGANRTGRWAGRGIQLQNLPRNYLRDLDLCRQVVASGDYELMGMMFDDISDTLSQLIRTAFIAPEDNIFAVADFSAIEARVIAWLAGEQWRIDVFNTHGKIYEASASMMFNIPLEKITKGSEWRYKGKVAELALGYQGSVGAMMNMGADKMGLSTSEMKVIVDKWRLASPNIVKFWKGLEDACKKAMRTKLPQRAFRMVFEYDGKALTIQLPSGRKLFYVEPSFTMNKWGQISIRYKGVDQVKKIWTNVDTYGGKLAENVVQAVARDLLAEALKRLDENNFNVCMHVHDEAVAAVPIDNSEKHLEDMCSIMSEPVSWAPGLPLDADGYLTRYYKKD